MNSVSIPMPWRSGAGSMRWRANSSGNNWRNDCNVFAARLAGHKDRYKIKLRSVGYRLVYEVRDAVLLVIIVALGKRERYAVYRVAAKR